MIEFSKDIDKQAALKRAEERDREKSTRANVINTPLHYDFANNEAKSSVKTGNNMLGDVVAEEDKIEKPKPAPVKKGDKYDKSKELGDFSDGNGGFELTKE